MPENVYEMLEVVGTSEESTDQAIRNAISRASKNARNMGWFEVLETRGQIKEGSVAEFQVRLKIGFRLDE